METLVLGAGLAGLSAAWHLGRAATVLEGAGEVGGLCRSYRHGGYTFDLSGHLLHFRDPSVRELVERLLGGNLARHRRRAYVHFRGGLVPYPFQANLHALPPDVREECLGGFLEAARRRAAGAATPRDFGAWLTHNFGTGIVRHFLGPYNRKMWRSPLRRIDPAWAAWAVPVPTVEQIREAARADSRLALGYNPIFFYPREGGIGVLAEALARGDFRLHLGDKAVEVDVRRRRVLTAAGRLYPFERLVSTLPLPELLRMAKGLDAATVEAGERLRQVGICIANVGLARPAPHDAHWVYFPEPRYPFYRVGISSNFAPACAPQGSHALYVEATLRPEAPPRCAELWPALRRGLERAGFLRRGEEPEALDLVHVPHAYVLYDRPRARLVPEILARLAARGVRSIGRYGAWEYSAMEDALRQGREAAASISDGRR